MMVHDHESLDGRDHVDDSIGSMQTAYLSSGEIDPKWFNGG